jgi:hypothetical protein
MNWLLFTDFPFVNSAMPSRCSTFGKRYAQSKRMRRRHTQLSVKFY